jgi:hypothetical protein
MKNEVKLETGKVLNLTSKSSREVLLSHHSLSTIDIKSNKRIISEITIDDYSVKVGDVLQIKIFSSNIMPFKVNYIVKLNDNQYSLLATKLTTACRFVMPMLRDMKQTYTSMKYKSHLVNCYVGTKDEGYMPKIYLVYRFSTSREYGVFEESLKKHELYRDTVDLDRYHVMYIFDMNEEQQKIFELFKTGKYSHFPENYKKQIINFVVNPADAPTDTDKKTTVTYGTLYRTDLQKDRIQNLIGNTKLPRDAEYFSVPDEINEVYTGDIEIPKECEPLKS